jgi:rRNA-processing protein FCF1
MIVIVDTNFLIYCAKYKIDILSELENLYGKYEVLVPQQVFSELQKLEKGHGVDNIAASLALRMVEKMLIDKKLEILGIPAENADEEIVNLVRDLQKKDKIKKIKVGTMDIELSDKVKKLGAKIIKIRQKKKICEE